MSFETILDAVAQHTENTIEIEKQIREIQECSHFLPDFQRLICLIHANQTLVETIKEQIEEAQKETEGHNQVGCFQQLCNCPASDSDYPTDIVHKKYCRFYRDRIGC